MNQDAAAVKRADLAEAARRLSHGPMSFTLRQFRYFVAVAENAPVSHAAQALSPRRRAAFRTRSVEAVRSLVSTGAGVALLPDLIYRPWSLEGDRIESRDVSGALPVVQVGIVWRKGAPPSAAAREFIALSQAAGGGGRGGDCRGEVPEQGSGVVTARHGTHAGP